MAVQPVTTTDDQQQIHLPGYINKCRIDIYPKYVNAMLLLLVTRAAIEVAFLVQTILTGKPEPTTLPNATGNITDVLQHFFGREEL